jgi:hypothetical protein
VKVTEEDRAKASRKLFLFDEPGLILIQDAEEALSYNDRQLAIFHECKTVHLPEL